MLDYREPSVQALRDIVAEKQAVKFRYGSNKNSVLVDLFSASALCVVYDALEKETSKKKFEDALGDPNKFIRLVNFAFQHVK